MTPIRSCSICRKKSGKSDLFRIVAADGTAILDEKQNINARGIYICKSEKCISNLIKALDKSKFNVKINASTESLKQVLEGLIVRMGE